MKLIQNILRSQVFAGLENVTNKKANTSRLPNTAKEKYMTPALMREIVEPYFCSPRDRNHKGFMLLEKGPYGT